MTCVKRLKVGRLSSCIACLVILADLLLTIPPKPAHALDQVLPGKREASVFMFPGTNKIGVILTTWPSSKANTMYQESYFVSSDLGKRWQRVKRADVMLDPLNIGAYPADSTALFRRKLVRLGSPMLLERSSDGGKTWEPIEAHVKGTSEILPWYTFCAFHPKDSRTLYVIGGLLGSGNASESAGLYVSHDSGHSFALLVANVDDRQFAIGSSHPEVICVSMFHKYLLKSEDSGEHWQVVVPGLCQVRDCLKTNEFVQNEFLQQWITDIAINATDPKIIFAQCSAGIWRTDDGGTNWCFLRPVMDADATISSLVVAGSGSDKAIFAGTTSGLYVLRDAGKGWELVDFEGLLK